MIDVFRLIDPFEDRRTRQQQKAKRLVYEAIKAGTLTKPSSCSKCGNAGVKIEGHHADYSKPLEVVWLCKKCHRGERKTQ